MTESKAMASRMKVCDAPECERDAATAGSKYCVMHKARMYLWGSLDLRPEAARRARAREECRALIERCLTPEATEDGGCWEWPGTRNVAGYGIFGSSGAGGTRLASRVAWMKRFGPIDKGLVVCHRCDNPPCVRPSHLFVGTNRDNTLDMIAKDRQPRGERNARAKLRSDQVEEIRARFAAGGVTKVELAREFGVSDAAIRDVIKGRRWRHVADGALERAREELRD